MTDLEELRRQRRRLQQVKQGIVESLADAVVNHKVTECYYRSAYASINESLMVVGMQIAAYEPQGSLFADD